MYQNVHLTCQPADVPSPLSNRMITQNYLFYYYRHSLIRATPRRTALTWTTLFICIACEYVTNSMCNSAWNWMQNTATLWQRRFAEPRAIWNQHNHAKRFARWRADRIRCNSVYVLLIQRAPTPFSSTKTSFSQRFFLPATRWALQATTASVRQLHSFYALVQPIDIEHQRNHGSLGCPSR